MYTTAFGLLQPSLKDEGKSSPTPTPSLPPQCDLTFFSLKYIWRHSVYQNLSKTVGLLGRIWRYVSHWCLPVPRSEDLEGKEAVI